VFGRDLLAVAPLLPHLNTNRGFVVVQEESKPSALLPANSSHALSEANQQNAVSPLATQQPPQLHHQPNAVLCPIVMTNDIPQFYVPCQDPQLLGAGHSNSDNIFFGSIETFCETSSSTSYLSDNNNNNNSHQQQQPPALFYLIDSLHDEARSEIIAEQNLYAVPQDFSPPDNDQLNYQNLAIEFPSASSSSTSFSPPAPSSFSQSSSVLPSFQNDSASFVFGHIFLGPMLWHEVAGIAPQA
jgi:hypothetical protein